MIINPYVFGAAGPPTTNMAAWYRLGVGITHVANAVSEWADQSGNVRHLAQAVAGSKPTLQGEGSILLDGTDDFMKATGFTLNQPVTWYVRIKLPALPNAGGSNKYAFDGDANNSGVTYFQDNGDGIPRTYAGSFGPVGAALSANTWTNIATVQNGASSVVQVGGTSSSAADMGAANPGGITIGAIAGNSNHLNAYFAEVIVYAAAHDATERGVVMTYLSTVI